jgi:hypothetical protein
MLTAPAVCVITNQPAKYFDPLTQCPYATIDAFKQLRARYAQVFVIHLFLFIQIEMIFYMYWGFWFCTAVDLTTRAHTSEKTAKIRVELAKSMTDVLLFCIFGFL